MGLSINYKKKLNILIPFYRKKRLEETKEGKWQQAWFYKDEITGVSVCSSKVYCALEKNRKVVHDEVYRFASNKLNKEIFECFELDKKIKEVVNKLFLALNDKEEDRAITILQQVLDLLLLYQDVLYYGEIYWFFHIFLKYLQHRSNVMTHKEFMMLDSIASIYHGKLYELVIYYLYIYANYHLIEDEQYLLNKYEYRYSNFIANRLFYISSYERKGLYLKAYLQYKKIEKELLDKNNIKQLAYVYISMINMLSEIDYEQMNQYRDKLLQILEKYDFTSYQRYSLYMYLGRLYILRDNYEISIECMLKALSIINKLYYRSYISLCYCFQKIHKDIYSLNYKIDESLGDNIDSAIYNYFKNKLKRTNKENRDYIMKVISPNINKQDTLYVKIIEDELKVLCKKMKSYQKLYEFQENLRKK